MELRLGRPSYQLSARLYRPPLDKETHRHQGPGRYRPLPQFHKELFALEFYRGCSRSVRFPLLGCFRSGH